MSDEDDDDISGTLAAKSNQLNADDLIGGPIVVRIEDVRHGDEDQPMVIDISGGHQPWKPGKTARRCLAACWGTRCRKWIGRSVELYRDPDVTFGGQKVGGIRVRAASHIEAPVPVMLTATRGKKALHRIEVLKSAPPGPRPALMACVKSFNATQMDLIDFMQAKSKDNVSPGPVDSWPDRKVSEVLARLQGSGGETFNAWLAARVNASSVPDWQDDENRNPESDELPE